MGACLGCAALPRRGPGCPADFRPPAKRAAVQEEQPSGSTYRWSAPALVILAASLTTAATVSFSGIIGFVGLIVPHLARMLWGVDYRHLIPLSILGGATCLLVADLLSL
jgi:ABC-type cobalamin transport system permease subunit